MKWLTSCVATFKINGTELFVIWISKQMLSTRSKNNKTKIEDERNFLFSNNFTLPLGIPFKSPLLSYCQWTNGTEQALEIVRDRPLENLWGGGGRAKYKKKIRAREN